MKETGKIGFIGLGHMGAPMCVNLLRAGFDVVVHDIDRAAAAVHLEQGAAWADSPAQCARSVTTLITMLPGPSQVEQVLLAEGAADGLDEGATWLDMSTSTPATARRIGARLAERGVHRLDAPVSGMVRGATDGTLQIFVGGDRAVLEDQLPVLEAMGDPETIFHMGPHGAGYVTKLVGNALWFAHVVATSEVLALGVKAGIDVEALRQTIVHSPHSSVLVERDFVSVYDGDYCESFAVSLACKDAGLAVDIGRDLGVPLELSGLVEQIYRRAALSYGPGAGALAPARLYEELSDVRLRPRTS
jgi:3-hydroxyisobutyrate dehydrogenase